MGAWTSVGYDVTMGLDIDDEEMSPGSTVPHGQEHTEKACNFVQETENKKILPQDADDDVGIQGWKPTEGTRIPVIPSLHNMLSQHRSVFSITKYNKTQRGHTDGEDSVLSNPPSLLRLDADLDDEKTELSHGAHVSLETDTSADDKCIPVEESISPVRPVEIMGSLHTNKNDDRETKTSKEEIHMGVSNTNMLNKPVNPDIDQMEDEGYTLLYKATLEGHLGDVDDLISRGANPNKPSKGGLRPLHAAAQEGHAYIVDLLILHGADVRAECDLGRTPLHTAAAEGNVDILASFIAEGADVNKGDAKGWTSFNAAVQYGHLEAVKYLMTKGAKQNRYAGMTPLYAAAEFGHLEVVKFFISNCADVNEEDAEGIIALHGAAFRGHLNVIEYLIKQGSDVNKKDNTGLTSFNAAVQEGHLEAVKYLMSKGAKPDKIDGVTPLYAAAQFGHLDIVKFLTSNAGDVMGENDSGQIPLHSAAAQSHLKVMKYLIQQGSDVNKGDAKGWTPFNAAVQYGHLEAMKYVMFKGAKQNRYDGMTPLSAAARFGQLDIVKLFVSNGADVNEEHEEGMIPLHGAAAEGHLEIMEYLIQQGSDVNKTDAKGWTPFNAAVQYGHPEAVKYLICTGEKQKKMSHVKLTAQLGNLDATPLHAVLQCGHLGVQKFEFEEMSPLYMAAYYGHLDIVKFLVSQGLDVNEEDSTGRIPVHAAAANGHTAVTRYLTEVGCNVNEKDNNGWTPLYSAIHCGHLKIIKCLISNGAEMTSSDGINPLYMAAFYGHLDIVEFLISQGVDVNKENKKWRIPLHAAAANGHLDVTKYLIQIGSDINKEDEKGWTPLHTAIQYGHVEVIKYLLYKGAIQTKYSGMTPLYMAAQYGHLEVVNLLISKGADVNEEDMIGQIPLHAASTNGRLDIINSLILKGSDVNKADHRGATTLHAAVHYGHFEVVKHLLTQGARKIKFETMNPLFMAANYGHLDIVKFFLSHGLDVNEEDSKGRMPLHAAAANGHTEVTRYLTELGSNVNKNDGNGRTPFQEAIQPGHFVVVKHLVTQGAHKIQVESMKPLYMAAYYGHLDIVKFFVSRGLDVNEEDSKGRIPLHAAAANGHTEVTRYLTEVGSNFNKNDNNGWTSPHKRNMAAPSFPLPIGKQPSVRQTKEKTHLVSPLTDGSELPMNEHSSKSDAPNTSPSAALRRSFVGDFTSRKRQPANSIRNTKKKYPTTNSPSSTILVLLNTFLNLVFALAILLAASPVLVAGSGITKRVTLQAGKPGVVPFHLPWSPRDLSQGVPFYTLRFESNPRPFCINGTVDIKGFKNPSQVQRFSTSVTDLDTAPCVKLNIDNVDGIDEDGYVLTAVLHSFENSRYEIVKKEINVKIPPGPAHCFITLSQNRNYPYEVHCRATSGSVKTTLSCYQNDQDIDVKSDITDNHQVTSGIFLLPHNTYFSCCSHDVTSHVNETTCNDFEWPPIKETTKQTINTVPTSATPNISTPANEHRGTTPTPKIESHLESGACRQLMVPSLWHLTYLFVYLLAFVIMY